MIEESYVSFETARMLKEAGFDVPCTSQYTEGMGVWRGKYPYNFNEEDFGYSRPTQALAARWLREVHRIVVDATFIPPSTDGDVWQYFIGEIVWYFGNSKIIAWMPIPSFDKILEDNKDVLQRLKDK